MRWALKDRTLVDRYNERSGGNGMQVEGRAFTRVHVKQFIATTESLIPA